MAYRIGEQCIGACKRACPFLCFTGIDIAIDFWQF